MRPAKVIGVRNWIYAHIIDWAIRQLKPVTIAGNTHEWAVKVDLNPPYPIPLPAPKPKFMEDQ